MLFFLLKGLLFPFLHLRTQSASYIIGILDVMACGHLRAPPPAGCLSLDGLKPSRAGPCSQSDGTQQPVVPTLARSKKSGGTQSRAGSDRQ